MKFQFRTLQANRKACHPERRLCAKDLSVNFEHNAKM